jgi:hypothetical protein
MYNNDPYLFGVLVNLLKMNTLMTTFFYFIRSIRQRLIPEIPRSIKILDQNVNVYDVLIQ